MPRPSKQQERSDEILDAVERCIIQYGVAGATLQRIADECGLARPLLHHYVGNREDLLQVTVERFAQRADAEASAFSAQLPQTGRSLAAVELLFDARYASSSHDTLLFQALMVAAQDRPALREVLAGWYQRFVHTMEAQLRADYPQANAAALRAAATGIVALYVNADSLSSLLPAQTLFCDSRQAALLLLETLT